MQWTIRHSAVALFTTALILAGETYYFAHKAHHSEAQSATRESQLIRVTRKKRALNGDLNRLMHQYDKLDQEKNGSSKTGFESVAKKLFTAMYSYDSQSKDGTVVARQAKMKPLAAQSAITTFLPDGGRAKEAVATRSRLISTDVYLKGTTGDTLEGLVIVDYGVSVANTKETDTTILYKLMYDRSSASVTTVEQLGQLNTAD